MNATKKVVWLDDDPARARTAADIGAEFVNLRNADLPQKVESLLKGRQPSLVILDHILDQIASTNPLFQRGSTIAEAIKEHWPACPVVCVTNAQNVPDINARTRRTYDVLYPFVDFAKYVPRIEAISRDFAIVAKAKPKKARDLVKPLQPPEDEIERLAAALPDDLKMSFRDASLASRLFDWVNHLLDRPGFLFDSLWSATLLGLNDAGFGKVEEDFKEAKYAGVFARSDEPRWWSSRLSEALYKKCVPKPGELSWHVGRRLPGVVPKHFSSCFYCKEDFPETVAYLDQAPTSERKAMHLKCTDLHARYKRELYFEDIRIMQRK